MYFMDLIEFLRALFCVAFDIRDPRIPACDIIYCLQLEIKNMFNISLLVNVVCDCPLKITESQQRNIEIDQFRRCLTV
jgi:hypothetical protein